MKEELTNLMHTFEALGMGYFGWNPLVENIGKLLGEN